MTQVQPYINEFMQNGMPNMSMPDLDDSNAGVIIDGDTNQTITTPLKQQATVIPNPSSLLDVINNFPVLWEKDYSDDGFKGDRISNDPYGYRWSEMPSEYADMNWMQIPYPNSFTASSYFDFIFENGEVDMYVFVKTNSAYMMSGANGILSKYANYNMAEVSPSAAVKAVNSYGQGVSFKVYKLTVQPEDKLYVHDLILFNVVTGIAFDLSRAIPEDQLPTGISAEDEPTDPQSTTVEPTEPPADSEATDAVKPDESSPTDIFTGAETEVVEDDDPEETGQEVVEPEPEVIAEPEPEPEPQPEPTVFTLTDVIDNLPSSWVKDYSNDQYKNHYLTNETNRKWFNMSELMSTLSWIEIPQYTNFSYTDSMHFNYATTIYFITDDYYKIVNDNVDDFEFAIDQVNNLVPVTTTITSYDSWGVEENFYVYKLTVPAGYDLESLNWIESRTVGMAFDISALNQQ